MVARRNPRRKPVARPRSKPARPSPAGDTIPELYSGKIGVLLATGPSLSREDVEYLRPLHARGSVVLFGLNDAYKLCDFLDVLYFCDPRWLASNLDVLDYKHGQLWTQDAKVRKQHPGKVKRCAGGSGNGICKTPNHIHFGGNSGFQCLNLAWHFGIREFYLLGYNMGQSARGSRPQHFFGQHPKPLNQSDNYKGFVSSFRGINKADRKLITNCTYPTGLVGVFEQKPLREALPHDEKTRHIPDEPRPVETVRPCEEAAAVKAVPGNGRRTNMAEPDSGDHRDRVVVEPEPVESHSRISYGGPM